jgi:hypothetical protein
MFSIRPRVRGYRFKERSEQPKIRQANHLAELQKQPFNYLIKQGVCVPFQAMSERGDM